MIYLDCNATTAALPEVVDVVVDTMTARFSNPSSAHRRGSMGRRMLRVAREQVAEVAGCAAGEVVFTSGGTEGNNMAIAAAAHDGLSIIRSVGDHASILEPARCFVGELGLVPLRPSGIIDLEALNEHLSHADSALIATSWVNAETGIVQPVREIAHLAAKHGARLLLDAAQAVGRVAIDFSTCGADYLTFSGHKIHGPQGSGVLIVRDAAPKPAPILGGGQEGGLRSGTENLPGIAGLGIACSIRAREFDRAVREIEAMRDAFEAAVQRRLPEVEVNGSAARVCNTSNLRFPGIEGPELLAQLDAAGVCCSQASACSARRPEPSRVLRAMGLDEDAAFESLRFSFSVMNSPAEIPTAVDAIVAAVSRLRALA